MVQAKTVDKKINASKKVMRKELHSVKKQAKKEQKRLKKQVVSAKLVAKKEKAKNVKQDDEIAKLREDIEKLKKKKKFNTSHVSEYNIFIRKQIRSGLTFLQAVKQWNRYRSLEAKNKRRPSAYNQFIGSQMRLGKTWTQAIALWKLAKAGKLGKKGSTKTVTKTVVRTRTIKSKPKIKYRTRTITSKPKIKYRTRTKTVVRRVQSKPKIKYRTRTITSKPKIKYRTRTKTVVKRIQSKPKVVTKYRTRTITKVRKVAVAKPVRRSVTRIVQRSSGIDMAALRELIASSMSSASTITKEDVVRAVSADDEEIAIDIIQTYFKEVARFGFKKQLSLDEIVNAYLYALARIKKN